MSFLKLSENLVMLRHKKKKTQEEVADFVGVTKASVSKWENGQSMPDIMILPQLASFFDVTVDELLGYEPQLSKEQISKLHDELKTVFAKKGFDYALNRCRALVKQYYSCYPFLFMVCCLYLNHYNMVSDVNIQKSILNEASDIATHILENCKDMKVYNDTMAIKAVVDLMAGMPDKVIEAVEDVTNSSYLYFNNGAVLIQAYQMLGDIEKANRTSQIGIYTSILSAVSISVLYLASNSGNRELCYETTDRINKLIEVYKISSLNPNLAAQFHMQAAVVKCIHGDFDDAINLLEMYVNDIYSLMIVDKLVLHGDEYFNLFEEWYADMSMGMGAPRNAVFVWESALGIFDNPIFEPIKDNKKFKQLKKKLLTYKKDNGF